MSGFPRFQLLLYQKKDLGTRNGEADARQNGCRRRVFNSLMTSWLRIILLLIGRI